MVTPTRYCNHGCGQHARGDLRTPLIDVEFAVIDLETTGGSAANDRITEVGVVKVRGGQVTGTFHTLVNPRMPIPPMITALTGIPDTMAAALGMSAGAVQE
jgi:DNA polymerase III subunit epsilon